MPYEGSPVRQGGEDVTSHVDAETATAVEGLLSGEHTVPVAGTVGYLRRVNGDGCRIDSVVLKGPVPVVHPPTVVDPIGRVRVWVDGDSICARGVLAVRGVRPPAGFVYPVGLDLAAARFTFEDPVTGAPVDQGDALFGTVPNVVVARDAVLMAVVVGRGAAWPGAQLEVLADGDL